MYHTLTCKQHLNKATAIYWQGYTVYLSIKNYINIAHCHKMHWCQLPKTSQKHKVHRIIYLTYLSWIGGQRTSVLEWKYKALSVKLVWSYRIERKRERKRYLQLGTESNQKKMGLVWRLKELLLLLKDFHQASLEIRNSHTHFLSLQIRRTSEMQDQPSE